MSDDFSQKTKEILARRVAYRCSNPACRKPTIGPHYDPMKSTSIGVTAHITAAAPNGPRYNPDLSPGERQFIENGIWLCENCASLIDKNPDRFPIELLETWKEEAENEAFNNLQVYLHASTTTTTTLPPSAILPRPYAEAELLFVKRYKSNMGASTKNKDLYGDEPVDLHKVIWINHIGWRYNLKIYNNSSSPLYNLRISIQNAPRELADFDIPPKVNHILPYGDMNLVLNLADFYESTGQESIKIMEERFPAHFENMEFILEYEDERRDRYQTNLLFKNGTLVYHHV